MTGENEAARGTPVGMLGLGTMGAPMAAHLLAAGFALHVYNRTPGRDRALVAAGARAHASPAALARECEIVICMVNEAADVAAVCAHDDGAFSTLRRGGVVINMGTVTPSDERAMAAAAQERGLVYLDAPVTGGEAGAQAATLNIMVGGAAHDVARVRPVLAALGSKILHCGGVGQGQATKLCNQIMVAANLAGVCEAMALAARLGVDGHQVMAAAAGGAGDSWQLSALGPRILAEDWRPGFRLQALAKDLRAVLAQVDAPAEALPFTTAVSGRVRQAMAAGLGDRGSQTLAETCAAAMGREHMKK